jgi:hypothetical protein
MSCYNVTVNVGMMMLSVRAHYKAAVFLVCYRIVWSCIESSCCIVCFVSSCIVSLKYYCNGRQLSNPQ